MKYSRFNHEGYYDPTTYRAFKNIDKDEKRKAKFDDVAGADEEKIKAAEIYSGNIGLAFQIVDDIIDVEGVSYKAGKTLGKDAKYQKSTYVSVCGLEQSKEDAKALSKKAQKSLSAFDESEAKNELFALCDFLLFRNN